MCTNPITIYTNARYLSAIDKYRFSVPCGKCEECKEQKRNDYLARAYYEALRVQDNNGVSVFDTLTYSDEFVPSIYGIKCFRYNDLVLFRKRLRTNLYRAGYDVTKMSYFIAAEYGDNTARPHYHITLNAWFKGATAHLLHDHIHKAWTFGFTDLRVKQICLKNGLGALSYVTKYVGKSIGDEKVFETVIKQGVKNLSEKQAKDLFTNYKENLKIKHFQSRGFGEYLLQLIEEKRKLFGIDLAKEFHENYRLVIPDKERCYKYLSLGHYYIYKTFYDRVYNEVTGKYDQYKLNDIGISWKRACYIDSRDKFIERCRKYRTEMITQLNELTYTYDITIHDKNIYSVVRDALKADKIDLKEFAEYCLFYRNCSWLNSQYCPFEFYTFENDCVSILNMPKTIENRAYSKKYMDNGKVVEKPFLPSFRSRLDFRRLDVVTRYKNYAVYELLFDVYMVVDGIYKQERAADKLKRAVAVDALKCVKRISEKIY